MRLDPGTRIGAYEILSALGAGGMGEVYRARDTRLGRDVALKIPSGAFLSEPEHVLRFEREAQLLATLNHPHIAGIYGFEEHDSTRFIVLELIDGETLAQRLAHVDVHSGGEIRSGVSREPGATKRVRRRGLPIDEALGIARQIVDALEAAHARGIVHRDLKPGNVMLTDEGAVKVLDFGLAKHDAALAGSGAGGSASHSPTFTLAATQAGAILGTAAYMSPEQAKGRPADKRSDIWAFGCVLYEMLAGKRAFEGEDVSDTIAAVLRSEPDWAALPDATPPYIVSLLKRCLERDRHARAGDISVARFVLNDGPSLAAATDARPRDTRVSMWRGALPWTIAAAAAIVAIAVAGRFARTAPSERAAPMRTSADLGANVVLTPISLGAAAVISPDGSTMVFAARADPGGPIPRLFLRRLNELHATPLPGTNGADSPFFSPDSQWIAFFADGKLKKVSISGSAPVTLCDAATARGGTWLSDGTIVFQPEGSNLRGVAPLRVSDAGGQPEPFFKSGDAELARWPQMLPNGRGVLFSVGTPGGMRTGVFDGGTIVVQPLPSGERKVVQQQGYYARYVESGHLLFIRAGTLFAAPFDLARLETIGPAVPIADDVVSNANSGGAQYSVSRTGTLVYVPGTTGTGANKAPVLWMDQAGRMTPMRSTPATWGTPRFSPDGRRIAFTLSDGPMSADIWIYEWQRDLATRLTFDPGADVRPVWSPDSRYIAFGSNRGDGRTSNLYAQRADGTGSVERLTTSSEPQLPDSWHPSGKYLMYHEGNPASGRQRLVVVPIEPDDKGIKAGPPSVFLEGGPLLTIPMFSADGRWVAYLSNESGPFEVYVRPFPGPGGRWQVSNASGFWPTWSQKRNELYYQQSSSAGGEIMAVPFTVAGNEFRPDKPRPWSTGHFAATTPLSLYGVGYDLHPDGERIAVAPLADTQARVDKVVIVSSFFDELRRLAPGDARR
jgi:serine/threonine-protein kinase